MEPLDFLMEVCHADKSDNINYKPYEYGSLIQAIPIRKAAEMVKNMKKRMMCF